MSIGLTSAPGPYRLSVKQYHRMIDARVLSEDDRVELLEGFLVAKMPHNPPHDSAITRANRTLIRLLGDEWVVRVQCAITTRDSEPEPDLAVAEGPEEKYATRHPMPSEVALVIEVADSSLETDRLLKGRLYARARLEAYWIMNLVNKTIEVFAQPKSGKTPQYCERKDYSLSDRVPLVLRGQLIQEIPVQDLLPSG